MSFFAHRSKVIELRPADFQKQMSTDSNAVLIDVRTPEEFDEAKIPGARLINISSPSFLSEIQTLDKSKSYYVYCRSGNRSYHAVSAMIDLGFEKVYNLAGGIIDWTGEVES